MNHVGLITRCNKIVTRIKQNSAQKTRVFDVPVRDKDKDKEEEDNCPLPCPLLARARRPSPVVSSVNFKAHGVEDKNSKQINVTVGELAKRPSVFLTIETLNTKNPKGLGHLELVQEGKDMAAMIEANRQNLHKLWSKLDPCDQEVACVRGVALLLHGERSWEAGDWAAYHLVSYSLLAVDVEQATLKGYTMHRLGLQGWYWRSPRLHAPPIHKIRPVYTMGYMMHVMQVSGFTAFKQDIYTDPASCRDVQLSVIFKSSIPCSMFLFRCCIGMLAHRVTMPLTFAFRAADPKQFLLLPTD